MSRVRVQPTGLSGAVVLGLPAGVSKHGLWWQVAAQEVTSCVYVRRGASLPQLGHRVVGAELGQERAGAKQVQSGRKRKALFARCSLCAYRKFTRLAQGSWGINASLLAL